MKQGQILYTNKARCKDCYRCLRNCPVDAISMRDGQAYVEIEKCILCGTCIKECPQEAKQFRRDIDRVKFYIREGENIAVSLAPSFPAIFEAWEVERIPTLLRKLGFSYIAETAEAAYFVAKETSKVFAENKNGLCIGTSCPSFVQYIEKYNPELVKDLVPIVSPMIAHAKRLKSKLGKDTKVVFVGPCLAKKHEAEREEYKGFVDTVLTFTELLEWIEEEKIDFRLLEPGDFDEAASKDARLYALSGGMAKTAELETDNLNLSVYSVSGFERIDDAIRSFQFTKDKIFVEPLVCSSGCINGPGLPNTKFTFSRKESVINYAKNKLDTSEFIPEQVVNLKTSFNNNLAIINRDYSDEQIRQIFEQTGKANPEDQLNCQACGYDSCLENAKAILNGMVEIESCIPFMKRLAEQRTDKVIDTSPNGIVVLNKELEIIHMNPAFKKFFMCNNSVINKRISYLMDPEPFIKLRESDEEKIEINTTHTNYNLVCRQIIYKLKDEEQIVGIFVDITKNLADVEKLDSLRKKTIMQAEELLEHQITMAQQLAKLLGESTAKGEELVENLVKLTDDEKYKNAGKKNSWKWDTSTQK
ncbi:MAG: 4Fe-4S binding protein [Melioribacteraceae bacterium]|nr:4Fe-4S binding protein [Melioribacteraceae bacterium]